MMDLAKHRIFEATDGGLGIYSLSAENVVRVAEPGEWSVDGDILRTPIGEFTLIDTRKCPT